MARLASFLTCSEFGLSETELLELLMPTSNSAATLKLSSGNYNFSTLCAVRRRMSELHCNTISFLLTFSLSFHQSLFPFCALLLSSYFLLCIPVFIYLLLPLCPFLLAFRCLKVHMPARVYDVKERRNILKILNNQFCYLQIPVTHSVLVQNSQVLWCPL